MGYYFKNWVLPFVVALGCVVVVMFWLAHSGRICVVDGDGMNPTFKKGDVIFAFGQLQHRGDVLVVKNPLQKNNFSVLSVKRCVALSSDTVLIENKKLFINSKLQDDSFCISQWKLRFFSGEEIDKVLNFCNLPLNNENLNPYVLNLRNSLVDSLVKKKLVKNISPAVVERGFKNVKMFPFSNAIHWNKDFFGPVIVPFKGMEMEICAENILVYKLILERFEGCKVTQKGTKFMLNGKESGSYKFKNNYYFLLNDSRDDISDSRTFGFVPESYVVAKYKFIIPNFL